MVTSSPSAAPSHSPTLRPTHKPTHSPSFSPTPPTTHGPSHSPTPPTASPVAYNPVPQNLGITGVVFAFLCFLFWLWFFYKAIRYLCKYWDKHNDKDAIKDMNYVSLMAFTGMIVTGVVSLATSLTGAGELMYYTAMQAMLSSLVSTQPINLLAPDFASQAALASVIVVACTWGLSLAMQLVVSSGLYYNLK